MTQRRIVLSPVLVLKKFPQISVNSSFINLQVVIQKNILNCCNLILSLSDMKTLSIIFTSAVLLIPSCLFTRNFSNFLYDSKGSLKTHSKNDDITPFRLQNLL